MALGWSLTGLIAAILIVDGFGMKRFIRMATGAEK